MNPLPATDPRRASRLALASSSALLAAALSASSVATSPPLPSVSARIDGRLLESTRRNDDERAVARESIEQFIDPDRGAVTLSLRLEGPPPLRDGSFDADAATMAGPYWIFAVCVLTNLAPTTQVIGATYLLPVTDPSASLGGAAAMGFLADGFPANGATFDAPNPAAMEFFIDGAKVSELYLAPFSISILPGTAGMIGPTSWGQPIPSQPVPAPAASISVDVSASLTPGDTAVLAFVYVVN